MDRKKLNGKWLVLRTRSNHENVCAKDLEERKVPYLLPKFKKWKSKKQGKWIMTPIFPGYVFIQPDSTQLRFTDYIRGSCGILRINNEIGCLRADEVKSIQVMSESNRTLMVHQHLVPGKKVKVLNGPLSGMVGERVVVSDAERFSIRTDILGHSVSIDLNGVKYAIL